MRTPKARPFDLYLKAHPTREISFEKFLSLTPAVKPNSKAQKRRQAKQKQVGKKAPKPSKSKPVQFSQRPFVPYVHGMRAEFYDTREWRHLRAVVLMKSNKHCSMCGAGIEHGVRLHVDHIKPRSRFPHLELVESNMQVLCEDCNLGKGNTII